MLAAFSYSCAYLLFVSLDLDPPLCFWHAVQQLMALQRQHQQEMKEMKLLLKSALDSKSKSGGQGGGCKMC